MRFYSYGAQGYNDTNWGCVFRSFQNVQSATGRHVMTMPQLLKLTKLEPGNWAEPADFAHVYAGSRVFMAGKVQPKFTRVSQYRSQHMSVEHLEAYIRDRITHHHSAFIVDDSHAGHAVVEYKGRIWWVDPHAVSARRTLFHHQLRSQDGWLVLEVPHSRHTAK